MIENNTQVLTIDSQIKYPLISFKQHKSAYLVSIAVFSERFSFWGLQAVMVLFLMQSLFQNEKNAVTLVAAFGALNYGFSLLGGLIADKFIGIWKACVLGLLICLLGNLILVFSYGVISFSLGLSSIIVGASLFAVSNNTLIRMLYERNSVLKETGFLITCVAGNISGTLGPLIYGIFGSQGLWHEAFFVSVLFNSFSLLFFFKYYNHFFRRCGNQLHQSNRDKLGKFLILGLVTLAFLVLLNVKWLNVIFLISLGPLCFGSICLYRELNYNEKQHIKFILFLTILLLIFYTAVFQIYSSLTIFINRYVNRSIMGWQIPVPAFASLQCIFFIFCAPIVERLLPMAKGGNGFATSLLIKIPLGLVLGTIGFLLFGIGENSALNSGECGIGWIVLGNFFLGLGEVFLYPPILSAISSFSPKRWSSTIVGAFSISLALASYFSGQVANCVTRNWMLNIHQHKGSVFFHTSYAMIAFFLIGITILTIIIFSNLSEWYDDQNKLIHG